MFVLTVLEKIKETKSKFLQRSATVLQKIASYEEAIVKLKNAQLNKLKSVAKSKTGATLTITKKNFQDEELSHVLLLTTRQKSKIGNAFTNNISTDIDINKDQISKMIQSGR